jgi:hypothetical protein
MSSNVFERNPLKTVASVVLFITVVLDFSAAHLLNINTQSNSFFQMLNQKIAYKLEMHQHRKANPFYHHDLAPGLDMVEAWGVLRYRLITNSLGFKGSSTGTVQPETHKKRILFIGDSFTEGFGMPYEKTFVGMVDQRINHDEYEVLNAAVVSYSPKLYYLKTRYLLDVIKLKVDELYVFVDLSDMFNELEYDLFEPRNYDNAKLTVLTSKAADLIEHNSFIYNLLRYFYNNHRSDKMLKRLDYLTSRKNDAVLWTMNDAVYDEWGKDGQRLAEKYMQKLVDLCKTRGIKMTVAVYPYPGEIQFGQQNSRQIDIWKKFTASNNIPFINYYPDFFNAPVLEDPKTKATTNYVLNAYFIPGDPHWNEHGHRLIANKLPIK